MILIPVVSFIASSIVSYSSTKEGSNFIFAWKLMFLVAVFTFIIWEVNIITYKKLDKTNAFHENPGRRLLIQILYCMAATWLSYSFLYHIIYFIQGGNFTTYPYRNFLLFFFISTAISLVINSFYVIRYLQSALAYKEAISNSQMNQLLVELSLKKDIEPEAFIEEITHSNVLEKPRSNDLSLVITTGNKIQNISFNSMAYWYSSEGLVVLVLIDGKKMTTNFSSYAEFIELLPDQLFFQLNRQFVAHIQSILSINDDVNRKLTVELKANSANPIIEKVTVSRYRSQQLKAWFLQRAFKE